MTEKKSFRWLWRVGVPVLAGLLLAGGVVWWRSRARIPEVPLGVEHAVAMTYKGPELAIKPFRRGVDVNLRLERVTQKGGVRVYDFRYIINRPGLVDIATYLTSVDGRDLPNLPAFQVRGVASLSQAADRRILETEKIGIEIGHGYYAYMGTAVLLWVAGLFLLVFWRPRRQSAAPALAPAPLTAQLRELLDRLRAGTLDAAGKARLERVMFHSWQKQLAPAETGMLAVVRQVEVSPAGGPVYRMLEEWIHKPGATASDADVLAALAPYSVEPAAAKES